MARALPPAALLPAALALLAAPALAQSPEAEDDLEALLAEEVETASAHRHQATEAAASVTVITADEIDRAGYRTLADVLATVRGFSVTDDRAYAYVGVRGFGQPSDVNNRVAVFVDGVPARNGFNDAAPVGLVLGVPLAAVDRIEVIRGPGSALYGTGAMFGVVNVVLKDTRTLDGVRGAASLGAFGGYGAEAVGAADLTSGVGVAVAVHGHGEDGPEAVFAEFDAPPGATAGLDWERAHGVTGTVERGPLRLDVRYGERGKGIPTAIYSSGFGLDSRALDRAATASLRADLPLSPRVTVEGTGALDHYHTETLLPYPTGEDTAPYEVTYRTNATVARTGARVAWDATAAHRLVAGAEVASQFVSDGRVEAVDRTYYEASDPFVAGAVYAQGEAALTRALTASVGARADAVRGDVALSPRGALVYAPDGRTTVKLLAGSSFRAPSAFERTINLIYVGQAQATDLHPERVTALEVSAGHEVVPGLRLEAAAFDVCAHHIIENRASPSTGTSAFVNAGDARSRGVEAGAEGAAGAWRTRASVGLQRAWDPEAEADGARLPNAPQFVAKATAFGPVGSGLWLSVGGRAESARRTLVGTETAGFAVVDAALSADVLDGRGRMTVGVRNAFDADYALPARPEHTQASIPQRPRSAYVRLDVRI